MYRSAACPSRITSYNVCYTKLLRSFTVGLLHNLHAINRHYVTHDELAKSACEIEIDIVKEPIGKQDQYAAAFGGLNIIYFNQDGSVKVEPLYIKKEVYCALEENLIMFYVGNQRKASDILSEQKRNASQEEKFQVLKQMVGLVPELRDARITSYNVCYTKLLRR